MGKIFIISLGSNGVRKIQLEQTFKYSGPTMKTVH